MEGDCTQITTLFRRHISIHALRVEGDRSSFLCAQNGNGFLSTPSGWRATLIFKQRLDVALHFYPRPPGGGRPCHNKMHPEKAKFLSTPSGWRATDQNGLFLPRDKISIHALRVEGDLRDLHDTRHHADFYPRPPGGGRLPYCAAVLILFVLLSTPSGWRATQARRSAGKRQGFLSTPSGWRATFPALIQRAYGTNFYPRPPGGGRLRTATR